MAAQVADDLRRSAARHPVWIGNFQTARGQAGGERSLRMRTLTQEPEMLEGIFETLGSSRSLAVLTYPSRSRAS